MRLITGGSYQGKLQYAIDRFELSEESVIDGASCEWKDLLGSPLINHFHLWIKRMLVEEKDIEDLVNQMLRENPEVVIIVDELGCGIVPMDPFDRTYREQTGRICCKIATCAKEVHRVTCGIGRVIKLA